MVSRTPPHAGLLALVASLCLLPACSGGPTAPPAPPPASLSFTPDLSPPPAASVSLRQASRTSSSITLEVVATDLSGVASVYFDLVFNPAVVRFTGGAAGPYFAQAGAGVTFTVPADLTPVNAAGRLPVGVTITPAVTGVSGTGVICTLSFAAQAAGTTGMSFEARSANTPFPVTEIAGVAFSGGSLRVVR